MTPHRYRAALCALALFIAGAGASPAALAGYHSTTVTVTAYDGVENQTDAHPHTGAWNNHVAVGSVAVSPDLVERGLGDGTKIAIEGFKQDFVVRDKTADDLRDTVDIYMGQNEDKAAAFGKKRLRIWWHTSD